MDGLGTTKKIVQIAVNIADHSEEVYFLVKEKKICHETDMTVIEFTIYNCKIHISFEKFIYQITMRKAVWSESVTHNHNCLDGYTNHVFLIL